MLKSILALGFICGLSLSVSSFATANPCVSISKKLDADKRKVDAFTKEVERHNKQCSTIKSQGELTKCKEKVVKLSIEKSKLEDTIKNHLVALEKNRCLSKQYK
ncbi:MAG: hypothetical protein EBR09_09070 [Proteobacteria bacterium]|nr:hypothetical protein [Pseudomonadota bacterium]